MRFPSSRQVCRQCLAIQGLASPQQSRAVASLATVRPAPSISRILYHNATPWVRAVNERNESGTNRARIADSPTVRFRSLQDIAPWPPQLQDQVAFLQIYRVCRFLKLTGGRTPNALRVNSECRDAVDFLSGSFCRPIAPWGRISPRAPDAGSSRTASPPASRGQGVSGS